MKLSTIPERSHWNASILLCCRHSRSPPVGLCTRHRYRAHFDAPFVRGCLDQVVLSVSSLMDSICGRCSRRNVGN
jgi:hypothetical protein